MLQNKLWEQVDTVTGPPTTETAAINFRDFDSDGLVEPLRSRLVTKLDPARLTPPPALEERLGFVRRGRLRSAQAGQDVRDVGRSCARWR